MGRATEALAARMGEGAGGLLNATFGNAAELIIAVVALSKGLSSVVKASITGSIIGNILLVFGLSILCGGTKYKEQRFNRTGARTSAISLSLAAIALIIPTVFHMAAERSPTGWSPIMEQRLSLAIALVLFLTYFCVLSFSLKTHRHFFQGIEGELEEKSEYWSRGRAIIILLVVTGFVALLAEFLVGTIESVRATFGLTETFVGIIVVAIIGNAAEHSSAILMALKNKMDLTVGIAIGSSLQIALFVAPLLLFVSYLCGKPMESRVFATGSLRRGRFGLHPVSNQRRRRNQLDRRRPASLRLRYPRHFVFLSAGSCRALVLQPFTPCRDSCLRRSGQCLEDDVQEAVEQFAQGDHSQDKRRHRRKRDYGQLQQRILAERHGLHAFHDFKAIAQISQRLEVRAAHKRFVGRRSTAQPFLVKLAHVTLGEPAVFRQADALGASQPRGEHQQRREHEEKHHCHHR